MKCLMAVFLLVASAVTDPASRCGGHAHLKRGYREASDKPDHADDHDTTCRPNTTPAVGSLDGVQQGTSVDTSVHTSTSPLQNGLQATGSYTLPSTLTSYGGFNWFPGASTFSANPHSGSFLLGNTVVVTKTRPGDVTAAYSRNKVGDKTAQNLAPLFQPGGQHYSQLYSPSIQQFSIANPSVHAFKPGSYLQPGYQFDYGFGRPHQPFAALGASSHSSSGDKNAKNVQYPSPISLFSSANPLTYGASFASPYGANLLNGNAFPMLTASDALSVPLSSGVYHSQPSYVNNFLQQKPLPGTGGFQPMRADVTTVRPHAPPVTETPDDVPSEGHRHHGASEYKYDDPDDDEGQYHGDHSAESKYDDEDGSDSSEVSSETSGDSPYLKTSQSVGRPSYDRDFAVEDIFKTSPKSYYSSSFHSEEPFGLGETSEIHDSEEKHGHRYKKKRPGDHDKGVVYGKPNTSSAYGGSRPGTPRAHNSKRAASYDGGWLPGDSYDDDTEVQYSEYRPQSAGGEVTKEDKKRDYYSYSLVTHRLSD